jgi:hypothetical protein
MDPLLYGWLLGTLPLDPLAPASLLRRVGPDVVGPTRQ